MNTAYLILLIFVIAIFLFIYFVVTNTWIKVRENKASISNNINSDEPKTRRDFIEISTITVGAIGTASFMWPFIKSMNPSEDTLALG